MAMTEEQLEQIRLRCWAQTVILKVADAEARGWTVFSDVRELLAEVDRLKRENDELSENLFIANKAAVDAEARSKGQRKALECITASAVRSSDALGGYWITEGVYDLVRRTLHEVNND
jgi:outer membrane murein-binding lipoprotein Lpp